MPQQKSCKKLSVKVNVLIIMKLYKFYKNNNVKQTKTQSLKPGVTKYLKIFLF